MAKKKTSKKKEISIKKVPLEDLSLEDQYCFVDQLYLSYCILCDKDLNGDYWKWRDDMKVYAKDSLKMYEIKIINKKTINAD